ncbi:MAG: hypothetical protein CMI31_00090 [Opitutae bacterium]|nr:hypothetical protein [Opitutae bacterium]
MPTKALSFILLVVAAILATQPASRAQDANASQPISPTTLFGGPEALGTNLGLQEIVEVLRTPGKASAPEGVGDASKPSSAPFRLDATGTAGIRAYRTNNVMRVQSGEQGAGVMELSAGANLAGDSINLFGREVKPNFLMMAQRAYYGQFSLRGGDQGKGVLKDILDYEFRMLNLSGAFALNQDWQANTAFEYSELRSFRTGEKKYHAFSPILTVSRMKQLDATTLLSIDTNVRYAFTKTISAYEIPGVFEDDGDNWQAGATLTYVKIMGPDGRLVVLPSVGFTRTGYLKNTHDGRADYLWTAGVSAMYSLTEHFGFQAFVTYGNKSANSLGRSLLGSSQKYTNLDIGVAITGQYDF